MREFKHPIMQPGNAADSAVISSDDILSIWQPDMKPVTVRWCGMILAVKHLLTMREVSQFVNHVMDMCFDTDHEIAVPEAADFAIRLNVLMMYAGIKMSGEIEDQYRIVYESGLYEAICEHINAAQMEAIRKTVETCVLHMM